MKTAMRLMLVVMLAAPAVAQEAVPGGHALDNNLMVGSGGINPPAAPYDLHYQNNIVTGNVGGLDRLHVDIAYRSPGDYTRNVGSDRLFRFQARSGPTGPTQRYDGRNPSIYRNGQAVTIDRLRGMPSGSYLIPRDAGSVGGYQPLVPQGPVDAGRLEPGASIRQGRINTRIAIGTGRSAAYNLRRPHLTHPNRAP
jgi:hypothetical protein